MNKGSVGIYFENKIHLSACVFSFQTNVLQVVTNTTETWYSQKERVC